MTMLPLADKAPPIPLKSLKFAQFRIVTPEIAIEVFVIENTGPGEALRLQSNTVLPRIPVMFTNGTLPLMTMFDSLKLPAERDTMLAFCD